MGEWREKGEREEEVGGGGSGRGRKSGRDRVGRSGTEKSILGTMSNFPHQRTCPEVE